jgi:fatty acid desaturase
MTPSLNRSTLQRLSVPSNLRALCDFFLVWGVIAAVMTTALWIDNVYAFILAMLVIGGRQNALATLAHEAWHGLLFPSRRLNHGVGAWIYAYPVGILYHHDRERHLRHHREVGHPHDPDWINYTSAGRESAPRLLLYLASLLLGRLAFSTLLSFTLRGRPRIGVAPASHTSSEDHPGVTGELLQMLSCQAVLLLATALLTGRWWIYFVLWALPLATFAGFFANWRALIEHVAVRDNVPPESRLRDIEASLMERVFIAPSHFNYHALHHAHPSIPHYNLIRGKEAYLDQFGSYPFTVRQGYVKTLRDVFQELRART